MFQIFEVKPPSVEALTIGTRVCAYWSQKYNHLYPGTISDMDIDPKLDSNFVNVELDDGDNRDIHVNSIRYLPPQYPLVGKYLRIHCTFSDTRNNFKFFLGLYYGQNIGLKIGPIS